MVKSACQLSGIRLHPEKTELAADGHDLLYIGIDIVDPEGVVVTDASVTLRAGVSGCAELAGFGTGNPVTDENYTEGETVSYRGHAMAVLTFFIEWHSDIYHIGNGSGGKTVCLFCGLMTVIMYDDGGLYHE